MLREHVRGMILQLSSPKLTACLKIIFRGRWLESRISTSGLLRVPWRAMKSNQSILKEINPEYSLMLKLKLQYFGHLIRRADSLEKTLMLGKIEGRRRRGQQRMRWLDGITSSMSVNLSKLPRDSGRRAWHSAVHGVTKSWTWLSDWVTTTNLYIAAPSHTGYLNVLLTLKLKILGGGGSFFAHLQA